MEYFKKEASPQKNREAKQVNNSENSIKRNSGPSAAKPDEGSTTSSGSPSSVPDGFGNILNPDPVKILEGIIWGEILGKPISKRRGR